MSGGNGINAHFRRVTGSGFSNSDETGLATPQAVAQWLKEQMQTTNADWVHGGEVVTKNGLNGGHGNETGSGTEWGASIWGMDDSRNGNGNGLSFDPNAGGNAGYGLFWLRNAHPKATQGEGLYIYVGGNAQAALADTTLLNGRTVWSGSASSVAMSSLSKQGNGLYLVSNGNQLLPVLVSTGEGANPQTATLSGGYFYWALYSQFNDDFRMRRRSATSLSDSDTTINIEKIIKL